MCPDALAGRWNDGSLAFDLAKHERLAILYFTLINHQTYMSKPNTSVNTKHLLDGATSSLLETVPQAVNDVF
eukprot:2934197-Pleurochrysis_carterae.AAC.1